MLDEGETVKLQETLRLELNVFSSYLHPGRPGEEIAACSAEAPQCCDGPSSFWTVREKNFILNCKNIINCLVPITSMNLKTFS